MTKAYLNTSDGGFINEPCDIWHEFTFDGKAYCVVKIASIDEPITVESNHVHGNATVVRHKLSGDVAHELYTSRDPFPLHDFLDRWKEGKLGCAAGFVIAVIGAYNHMVINGKDGRYGNVR